MSPLTPERARELSAEAGVLAREAEWREVCDRLGDLTDAELGDHPVLALLSAKAHAYTGSPKRALTLALAAESAFATSGAADRHLDATNLVGSLFFEVGDLVSAEDRFAAAVERASEAGHDLWLARASNNLGAAATLRGQLEHALSLFRLAVPAYQKLGDSIGLAETYHNMAITFRDLGYWREADAYYARAQDHAARAEDRRLVAMARLGRAELALRRDDVDLAAAEAHRMLAEMNAIGDALGRAEALKLLGSASLAQDKPEEADSHLRAALEAAREGSNPLLEAEILLARSELHERRGDRHLARSDAEAALGLYRNLGARGGEREAQARVEQLQ